MLVVNIPGFARLQLEHLVLDYNGTIACDGQLIQGVAERLRLLSGHLQIHILTADTFGGVKEHLVNLNCAVSVLRASMQDAAKGEFIDAVGPDTAVAVGNGRNDHLMLKRAALGIAVLQTEGASINALLSADVVVPNIADALDLLLHPLRLTATLRS